MHMSHATNYTTIIAFCPIFRKYLFRNSYRQSEDYSDATDQLCFGEPNSVSHSIAKYLWIVSNTKIFPYSKDLNFFELIMIRRVRLFCTCIIAFLVILGPPLTELINEFLSIIARVSFMVLAVARPQPGARRLTPRSEARPTFSSPPLFRTLHLSVSKPISDTP